MCFVSCIFYTYRFNQAKPKSEVEARVYEVLSHKNWGSSSTIMNEVARDTYDYDKCKWHVLALRAQDATFYVNNLIVFETRRLHTHFVHIT